MKKTIKLALGLGSFLAVHLSFALELTDAQTLPTICANPNVRFLTGPEFLTNPYTNASQIRTKLQGLGSWLQGDSKGEILDVDPNRTPINFAQVVFDAARNPTNAPAGQERPINPDLLLAMVQKENRMLVVQTRPSDPVLAQIMNCPLKPTTIVQQVKCAAETLRNKFDTLAACQETAQQPSWGLNKPFTTTQDGVNVTPANASTGAFFSYEPYAGNPWGGNNDPAAGANANFCLIWHGQRYVKVGLFAKPPTTLTLAPQNPTLTCSAPEAQRNVSLSVSGGTSPYTWSVDKHNTDQRHDRSVRSAWRGCSAEAAGEPGLWSWWQCLQQNSSLSKRQLPA